MRENPKAKKPPGITKKNGFYVALYSSVGVMLVLAVVIGYNNFASPKSSKNDSSVTATGEPDLATVGKDTVQKGQPYLTPNDKAGDIGTAISGDNQSGSNLQPYIGNAADKTGQAQDSGPSAGSSESSPVNSSTDENIITIDIEGNETADEVTTTADGNDETDSGRQANMPRTTEFTAFDDNSKMNWPVLGDVVMDYSVDHVIYDQTLDQYRINDVLCISAEEGSEVRAAADGIVSSVTTTKKDGKKVVIDHGNGWLTTYSQLQDTVLIDVGDVVSKGQIIGGVGSPSIYGVLLGNHLGFAVSKDSRSVNPKDVLAMQ